MLKERQSHLEGGADLYTKQDRESQCVPYRVINEYSVSMTNVNNGRCVTYIQEVRQRVRHAPIYKNIVRYVVIVNKINTKTIWLRMSRNLDI